MSKPSIGSQLNPIDHLYVRHLHTAVDTIAVGIILPFAGNGNVPNGYLLCDGSAVSRGMYPDLFTAIGTTYGSGDGSTTFNLPDSNQAKRFLQGDTVAGTVKQAGLPTSAIYSDSVTTVQPHALTTRYIIKAFDGQTADSALIDITQYAQDLAGKADKQDLAGKADKQLSNLDTNNLSVHVVVESVVNKDGSWYRKYSDGWLEQGGMVGGMRTTVTFPKAFTATPTVVGIARSSSSNGVSGSQNEFCICGISNTSFYGTSYDAYGYAGFTWRACGK